MTFSYSSHTYTHTDTHTGLIRGIDTVAWRTTERGIEGASLFCFLSLSRCGTIIDLSEHMNVNTCNVKINEN